jgi:hypothetical protein
MAGVCGRGSHSLYSNWEAGRGRRRVGEKRERERERERERCQYPLQEHVPPPKSFHYFLIAHGEDFNTGPGVGGLPVPN